MNSFGTLFRFTTFGESHGPAIGGIIDGIPAGVSVSIERVQQMLDLRRPGAGGHATTRREADRVEVLSGIYDGCTLGTPIGFIIRNENQHSADYDNLRDAFRPSHADYTYQAKYGIRDHRGGGRASARETACRVVAGAFAMQVLEHLGVSVVAFTRAIGGVEMVGWSDVTPSHSDVYSRSLRCPDAAASKAMESLIAQAREERITLGGIAECHVCGLPSGIGEPVYGKLSTMLAAAMMSINAAKGVEFGLGFDFANATGPAVNDPFYVDESGDIRCSTNNSGGIQGGISNGMPVVMRVAFKPVATALVPTDTVDVNGKMVTITPRGRHDLCVVPRAVPVVQAMAACTILDALLINRAAKL